MHKEESLLSLQNYFNDKKNSYSIVFVGLTCTLLLGLLYLFSPNLLHHFDRQTNMQLLQKSAAALKPGGTVAILDQIESKARGSVANALMHLMALQYYLFADGRVFDRDELSGMLTQASFSAIQFHQFAAAPGTSLMTAAYQ